MGELYKAKENAIRPFVVGRRSWLFCDTIAGTNASANLYSLVEAAKANGIDPYRYLEACSRRFHECGLPMTTRACFPGTSRSQQEAPSAGPPRTTRRCWPTAYLG